MTETYYITRWKGQDPKDEWHTSSMGRKLTEAQAREQLTNDIGYFYRDIEIQVVRVTEEVMEIHHGSQPRP